MAAQTPITAEPPVERRGRVAVRPTHVVIFGATGDLGRRKLLPALYNLAHDGALPERVDVVGVSRRDMTDEEFRSMAAGAIRRFSRRPPTEQVLARLLDQARHIGGSFDDPRTYETLRTALVELDDDAGRRLNRCYYLSSGPRFFPVIIGGLGEHGLSREERADVRVVIEKPFGTTLRQARELNRRLLRFFAESQVFRIDHYLAKETVQNIMVLRFANGVFEPVWNRNYIDHVQITVAEDIGIGSRAGSYDTTGALRDVIQNHVLQLLCHVAMEPPVDFTADGVRNEKVKVLQAIVPPPADDIAHMAVRGQYMAGSVGGRPVLGYREEEGIRADSMTETYAALRLEVDTWRWAGVPFYLRTGKRLARNATETAVSLQPVPHLGFSHDGSVGPRPNQLVLTVEPDEGVSLTLTAKIPGTRMRLRPVKMEFLYGTTFGSESPDAYERLVLDAMRGDGTLFTRNDEIEAQWRIVDPILRGWESTQAPLFQYRAGSQGPTEADEILLPGHRWRAI